MSSNSEIEIDRIVLDILRENGVRKLPIDVFSIAKRSGIEVIAKEADSNGVSGVLILHGNNVVIAYNSAIQNIGFQRFSVGHELGHFFLPGHMDALLSDGSIHQSGVLYDDYEKAADSFAAKLLMPKPLLPKRFKTAELRIPLVESLADLCEVSVEAAALRIASLTSEQVAVARVHEGIVDYCFMSEAFKRLKGLTWIRRGAKAAIGSHASRLSVDNEFVRTGGKFTDESCLSVWFSADYEHPIIESVIGLGEYGKCLVLLHCPEADDQDVIEHEEESRAQNVNW